MDRLGHLAALSLIAAVAISCDSEPPLSEPTDGPAEAGGAGQQAPGAPKLASVSGFVPIARVEGYGNPKTGELWIRPLPAAEPVVVEGDGVRGVGQPLLADEAGHCSLMVVNDGTPNSNPEGTFELYTQGEVTGTMEDMSSFDVATCYGRLDAGQQDGMHSTLFSSGVGCSLQHIGNFTDTTYSRVMLDIDVFNGDPTKHGPFQAPFTTATAPTPAGRNAPHEVLGLWDFGSFAPDESKNIWIYFRNGDPLDFTFTGFLLGEVFEDCGGDGTGNGVDEDCDEVIDNGCGQVADGEACYADGDCAVGNCNGEMIMSGIGEAGGGLGDDIAGVCGPLHCVSGDIDGDETDLNCGGSCPDACAIGQGCFIDADCDGTALCNSAGFCYDPALCGDGNTDPGEQCDSAGSNDDNSGCKTDCSTAFCGDGFLHCGTEVCDGGGNCHGDCMGRPTPETFTFVGSTDGETVKCSNWSPFGLPASTDTARFDSSSPSVATHSMPRMIGALELTDTFTGTLTVNATLGVSGSATVNGGTLTLGGGVSNWVVQDLLMGPGGTINGGVADITVTRDATFTTGFNAETSEVILNGAEGSVVNFGDATLNGLSIVGRMGNPGRMLNGAVTVNGQLNIGSGLESEAATHSGTATITANGHVDGFVGSSGALGFGSNIDFDFWSSVDLGGPGAIGMLGGVDILGTGTASIASQHTFGMGIYMGGNMTLIANSDFGFVTVAGTLTQDGFDLDSTTMGISGTLNSGTGALTVDNLTVAGGGLWDATSGTATVTGDLTTMASSSVNAPDSLTVGGNLSLGGTFNAGVGVVELAGSASPVTVSANSVTFNDLSLTGGSSQYQFEGGTLFDITGMFTAVGDTPTAMTLSSTMPGTPWNFTHAGFVIDEVSVQDSTNNSVTIEVQNWVDLGNNLGWLTLPTHGYFVMTNDLSMGGMFGGKSSAIDICVNELNNGTWLGKTDAMARGLINSGNVQPFLCDEGGCFDGQANTEYRFASVQNSSAGGASFTTNFMGLGPGNTQPWGLSSHFGMMGSPPNNHVWTGRDIGGTVQWSSGPSVSHCSNWTGSGSGAAGRVDGTVSDAGRWWYNADGCSNPSASLICWVNP